MNTSKSYCDIRQYMELRVLVAILGLCRYAYCPLYHAQILIATLRTLLPLPRSFTPLSGPLYHSFKSSNDSRYPAFIVNASIMQTTLFRKIVEIRGADLAYE
ncbi:hypothetical protein SK128_016513 [Halocaridina rubra]|uniref:Uncharacterized protein n=1 Tax=Halocaridina rubra TaxID=373956 RepID=A0AAN9ADJ5_HALRR